MCSAPQKETQVNQALIELKTATDRVEDGIKELHTRLGNVLKPIDECQTEGKPDTCYDVPIATTIKETERRLQRIHLDICDLLNRLGV